jgi:hypothetical protein
LVRTLASDPAILAGGVVAQQTAEPAGEAAAFICERPAVTDLQAERSQD